MPNDLVTQITAQPHDELQAIVRQILGEGATPFGEVKAIKFGRSVGHATAGIFHVSGQALHQGHEAQWSAVVKVLGQPENRSEIDQSSLVEIGIYRSRAFDDVCGGVRAPRCYAIQKYDDVQMLWLEDLSHAPQPPWQSEHFVASARHLGRFNGYWPEDALPTWEWLQPFSFQGDFTESPTYKAIFAQGPTLLEDPVMRAFVSEAETQLFATLWNELDMLFRALGPTPMGICHLDCHPKNLFPILNEGEEGYTVAIDWTQIGVGNLGIDIGHLLASPMTWLELTPEEAAALRNPVFDAYVAGLADSGWSGDETRVRAVFLTRLACEAIRNTYLISNAVTRPQWRDLMERHVGYPILEIAARYHAAREFYVACKDEAMQLVKL